MSDLGLTPDVDVETFSQHELKMHLLGEAEYMRSRAYAPYSEYRVGAVAYGDRLHHGANLEVSGRNTSIHAEAMAIFNASLDVKEENVTHVAISGDSGSGVAPCGLCLHTLSQFCDEDTLILSLKTSEHGLYNEWELGELIHDDVYTPSNSKSRLND